ncbi:MAG: phytoene desaturase [Bacteroidia bacterium]|jgi:phytoene desaturase|nr:phytoene desaturase [Bacteroidia bacterium]
MAQKKKALIIGTGLGGLATGLRLTTKGYDVEFVEKYHLPGGRLNILEKDGFSFDMGPSFFSMSYEFKELFEYCGVENPLVLQELNPLYAVYFENRKDPFLIYKDLQKLALEFDGIEPDLVKKTEKYLHAAGKLFHDTEDIVIKRNFESKLDYLLQLTRVPIHHGPKMIRSMWSELEKNFDSQEVKVIFSLVSFFLGSTPFQTPAVYSLLNYTELKHDGYWNVEGGMYKITESIVDLLKQRGAVFHYNTEITQLESAGEKITAAISSDGRRFTGDHIVCNGDAASFRGKVLNRKKYNQVKLDKLEWTLAPFTIYLGVNKKLDKLYHHNYFLGSNFKEYADNIFKTSVSPKKPYYYVNVRSRSNSNSAPEGCDSLFILCPVPDLRFKPDWSDAEELADNIIEDMGQRIGYDIKNNTITKTILTPIDWQDKFNLYKGSGLGLAHGLNQVGGFRPSNKDEEFNNLYYVGASTVPGTGLPIVVISSRLATERILKEDGAL